jgi:hypothetical protein
VHGATCADNRGADPHPGSSALWGRPHVSALHVLESAPFVLKGHRQTAAATLEATSKLLSNCRGLALEC